MYVLFMSDVCSFISMYMYMSDVCCYNFIYVQIYVYANMTESLCVVSLFPFIPFIKIIIYHIDDLV